MLSQTGSVFWITAALSTALVLWGVLFTSSFGAVTRASFSFIVSNLSWFYMIAPTLICAAWFSIVGATAINLDQTLGGTLSETASSNPAVGFFAFLQYLPLPLILSLVSLFMLWIFFVAGADAGTIVLGEMSVGGITDPNRFVRLAWGAVIGAMAAVLLLTGGLEALQQAAILAGLPFAIVMIFVCYTMYKSMRADLREQGRQEEPEEEAANGAGAPSPTMTTRPASNPGK